MVFLPRCSVVATGTGGVRVKERSRLVRRAVLGVVAAAGVALLASACQSMPPKGPIAIYDQKMDDQYFFKVFRVTTADPAWLVAYNSKKGQPNEIVGKQWVRGGGDMLDIRLYVDPRKVTETMFVKLHIDAGQPEVFEYPGPDEPAIVDGKEVVVKFMNIVERRRF
jgi:hypothetical protein